MEYRDSAPPLQGINIPADFVPQRSFLLFMKKISADASISGNASPITAVSYTHLDVYKRQPLTAARIFALEATAGFKLRLFQRVAECDFLEVVRPHSSGLAGHVDAGRLGGFLHILSVCHGSCTCARDVRWIAFPETGRRTNADAVRRSPLCAHQIPGRRHR